MIVSKEDDFYIIKVFKDEIKNVDIYDIDFISAFFKDIFIKLKCKYAINGFCNVEVFVNKDYGMIIEINNFNKLGNEVDVKIKFYIDSIFLNEVDYDSLEYCDDCYFYNGRYYTFYKDLYDSEVIYSDTYKIIKRGIKIK